MKTTEDSKALFIQSSHNDSQASFINNKRNIFQRLNAHEPSLSRLSDSSKNDSSKSMKSAGKIYKEDHSNISKSQDIFNSHLRNKTYDSNLSGEDTLRAESAHRKLEKRDKICDTDTEDEGSDNEKEVKCLLLPDDPVKRNWDILVALVIVYSSIVMPYKIAFIDEDDTVIVDICLDVILWLDIVVCFFSAYTDSEDNVIKNRKKIIITYLKTWFAVDLISVLPISYLTDHNFKYNKLTRIGRLPKLYRLLKLAKLLRITRIAKNGNVNRITRFFLEKIKVNADVERLIYFVLSFLLLNHLSACIWYYVAKFQDLDPDCWVTRLGYIDSTNFEIYVVSFYWTLTTVTTVGYGDINAGTTIERVYNLFIMSFGVLMYSFAIGSLSSIVSTMDQKTAEMNQKLQILSSIKKEFNLDQEIYDKVRKVIKFDLSRNQKDKMNFLQELPNKLRIELSQIMHDRVIQNLYFFRDQPPDFFAYVAPLLKPVKFSQNDYLYKTGDMIDEMYFVSKGTVIFCLDRAYGEKEIKEIKKNNNFGEIEMCLNEKLSFNIKIKSRNCELFVLKKNDFLRLSVNFKEFIENFLHKSLMIYLRFNEEKKKVLKEFENLYNGDKVEPKKEKKDLDEIPEKAEETDNSESEDNSEDISEQSDEEKSESSITENSDEDEETDSKQNTINNNTNTNNLTNNKRNSSYNIEKEDILDKADPIKRIRNSIISENDTKNKSMEEIKRRITSSSIKMPIISNNNPQEEKSENEDDEEAESLNSSGDDDTDKIKNSINKKFIKKIDKILDYLDKSGVVFPNEETNPRILLKQLRGDMSITEKNVLIDKIENILKDFYKENK